MNLDEAQRKLVSAWIAEGLKLSDIQNRLASELGLRLTYMEVRLLVDDLKLVPKDVEPARSSAPLLQTPGATTPASAGSHPGAAPPPQPPPSSHGAAPPAGGVSVAVDQVTRPGAVISGQVTFSDGNTADWYLDQMGRLGLMPKQPGYRPPASDVEQFQMALERELSKLGI